MPKSSTTRSTRTDTVWFVLRPTPISEEIDLIAGGNVRDIFLQFRGGLDADLGRVDAMYTDLAEAEAHAKALIQARDAAGQSAYLTAIGGAR